MSDLKNPNKYLAAFNKREEAIAKQRKLKNERECKTEECFK